MSEENKNIQPDNTYTIDVDYREAKLIELLKHKGKINFNTPNLEIGDILFKKNSEIVFCIERKTISDLISSIKDGRYSEQTKRILEVLKPSQCCYLIEGRIPESNTYLNMNTSVIYGSIINKMIRDGIYIYQTNNLTESTRYINEFGKRFLEGKLEFINKGNNNLHVQKPRKKGDISRETCFNNQLANIPTISTSKIKAINTKHNTMLELISTLQETDDREKYLTEFKLENGRKLGKSSAQKILKFLGF